MIRAAVVIKKSALFEWDKSFKEERKDMKNYVRSERP